MQPDNITFLARIYGDEYNHGLMTIQGHKIIKNSQDYWSYAITNENGTLIPSEYIVGKSVGSIYEEVKQLTQPDESTFFIREFSDVFGCANWTETMEGYTIIKNPQKYWAYAIRDKEDKLVSSEHIVGIADPHELNLTKYVALNKKIGEGCIVY
jgi:hypothetical protein